MNAPAFVIFLSFSHHWLRPDQADELQHGDEQ
jgi:hypothetical protein